MTLLARDIAKRIEDELEYPGQIKVHLLREVKVVEYAKSIIFSASSPAPWTDSSRGRFFASWIVLPSGQIQSIVVQCTTRKELSL